MCEKRIDVSIIVPVYKAAKYIERMVCSLMEQTVKNNIEYVFIDDCSPDDSVSIIKRCVSNYPERTDHVIILTNEYNMGPSDTRKKGVGIASGEYVGFCDADDWVEPTMYESLLKATDEGKFDIVVSDYYCERSDGQEYFRILASPTPQDALSKLDDWHSFSYAMWNQLVRKTLLKEQIRYVYPTRYREDTYLMMRCYYYAKSVAFVAKALYHYNLLDVNSLIHSRKMSYAEWLGQKENMDRISRVLMSNSCDCSKYSKAVNCFKFALKLEYRESFPTKKLFYFTYRESHEDGVRKECEKASFKSRMKLYLAYNTNYMMYNLLVK